MMTHIPLRLALLSLVFLASLCRAEWVLVNPASQPNALPAITPLSVAETLKNAASATAIDGRWPVDVFEGQVYVAAALAPMGVEVIRPQQGAVSGPTVSTSADKLSIVWNAPFEASFSFEGGTFLLQGKPVLETNQPWKIIHQGTGLVALENGQFRLLCFATGGAIFEALKAGEVTTATALTYRKASEFLIARPATEKDSLQAPLDIALLEGRAVFVCGAKEAWQLSPQSLATEKAGNQLVILPWPGMLAAPADPSLLTAAGAVPPLIGESEGDGWRLADADGRAEAFARPANGAAANLLRQATWLWGPVAKVPSAAWVFSPADLSDNAMPVLDVYKLSGVKPGDTLALQSVRGEVTVKIPGGKASGATKTVEPVLSLWDWSKRGLFLQGNLLRGGPMFSSSAGAQGALDLDDDGDGDIFGTIFAVPPTVVDANSGGGFRFDMKDVMPGYYAVTAVAPGELKKTITGGYTEQIGPYAWMFSKSLLPGRVWQGASRGFEEHVLYRIRESDTEPVLGPASLFFKTTSDKVDRMSMGGFGRGDNSYIDWNIELDPVEASLDQPASYRICEYEDPFGNTIRFTSPVYPASWDGGPVPFENQGGRGADFTPLAPWYRLANENLFDLKGLKMVIRPEGVWEFSSEGMYEGNLTTGNRIEYDSDGATFILYYSDLMSGLHLKGAEHGHQGFNAGHNYFPPYSLKHTYRNDSLNMGDRFIGGRLNHTWEGVRLEGPLFLGFFDRDGDGFHDVYLYDADNDGLVERALDYKADTGTVVLRQGDTTAAWPWKDKRVEVAYLPGNYNQIEDLYIQGGANDPLVIRTELSSAGIPIERTNNPTKMRDEVVAEVGKTIHTNSRAITSKVFPITIEKRPDFFITLGEDWVTRIGLDTMHGQPGTDGFQDFTEDGFTGLALEAYAARLLPVPVNKALRSDRLESLDLLVMPPPSLPLAEEEIIALLEWVRGGGRLLIVPAGESADARLAMNGLLGYLGLSLAGEPLHVRSSINKYGLSGPDWNSKTAFMIETRYPSPDQAVENYTAQPASLLEELDFITAVGYPLSLGKGWQAVLNYQELPVMAQASLGKGKLLVSGIDLFSNRYLNHPKYIEPESGNRLLIRRLLELLAEDLPVLVIDEVREASAGPTFTLSGSGGTVRLPRQPAGTVYQVNGQDGTVRSRGLFDELSLPAGKSNVTLHHSTQGSK